MSTMETLLQVPSTEVFPAIEHGAQTDAKHLVVVLPGVEQEALLAGRILELARTRGLGILLVGVVQEPENDAELRRALVRIAAFIGDARRGGEAAPSVEIRVQRGMGWMEGVRCLLQPGDLLACCADWSVGMLHRPLHDLLAAGLSMPVYIFAETRALPLQRRQVLSQVGAWTGSLASIGAFCAVAARITVTTQGWLQSLLLLGARGVEAGLICFVNSLFGSF